MSGAGGEGEAGAGGASGLVNVLFMLDRGGSMLECVEDWEPGSLDCESGPSRWDLLAAALGSFFGDPASAGLGVAMRFFPHDLPVAGCTGGSVNVCDVAACAVPLVELDRLTANPAPADAQEVAHAAAIAASTPTRGSGDGTPTSAALAGALRWATTHQASAPDDTTAVVFGSDGEQNGCNTTWTAIDRLAADALEEANVRTFVVGLTGTNPVDMDGLASAGGTDQAYFVSDGPDATANLLAALRDIRNRL